MTRRCSLRAQARENYCRLAAAKTATPTPDPSPHFAEARGGGEKKDLTAQSLTEKARALYEDSAVPVREIAQLAGVAERTIYKYAAKQRWNKRYARAPEKGAGARFIAREHRGLPFAQGLKATDPAGATRAAAACRQAEALSQEAQAEAEREQRAEARLQVLQWTNRALGQLEKYINARAKQGHKQPMWPPPGTPIDDPVERAYRLSLAMAMDQLAALRVQEEAAQ